jgi:hypothetical protein
MNATVTSKKNNKKTAQDIFQAPKLESLSVITKALEDAHEIIRRDVDAPRATILVSRDTKSTMGHFTPWTPWVNETEKFHEIMISASYFERGARAILGTLLHETAHSIDNKNGIQGVTGEGYHNQKFKKTAESLGLTITKAERIGFSKTDVSDDCAERWIDALIIIENALALTASQAGAGAKPKGRNKNLLVAECECGEKIRLSLKTLEKCAPSCGECETEFKKVEA